MSVSAASSSTESGLHRSAAPALGSENPADDSRAGAIPTQVISFAIGDDQYGVDIMAVREIKGWTEITHLPRQPDYVRGVSICAASSFRSSICAAASARD